MARLERDFDGASESMWWRWSEGLSGMKDKKGPNEKIMCDMMGPPDDLPYSYLKLYVYRIEAL